MSDEPTARRSAYSDIAPALGDYTENVLFGDVRRPELADKLHLGHAAALVLTMDDPLVKFAIG